MDRYQVTITGKTPLLLHHDDIEVKALMDHFGVPTPGEVLAYEDLEIVALVKDA